MINRVILVGRLTRDPELRYTPSGVAVTRFSIAVNRKVKRKEEWVDEVSFFDITVFGNQGENCAKFLAKGRPVFVDGELNQRRWEQQDGTKRSKIEVIANKIQFLYPRPEGGAPEPVEEEGPEAGPPPIEDDDIPF